MSTVKIGNKKAFLLSPDTFVDGVFIDTDNVIASGTLNNGSQTYVNWEYTATEDCVVMVSTGKINNTTINISIDNKTIIIYGTSWQFDSLQLPLYVKKGQKYKITNLGNYSNYKVYGIQTSDEVKSDYHIYSTDERVVGEWIDGSTIYEKTVDVAQYNVTLVDSAWNNIFALSNVDYLVQAIIHRNSPNVNRSLRFQANDGYIQGAASQQVTLTSLSALPVTFQYTKSS